MDIIRLFEEDSVCFELRPETYRNAERGKRFSCSAFISLLAKLLF